MGNARKTTLNKNRKKYLKNLKYNTIYVILENIRKPTSNIHIKIHYNCKSNQINTTNTSSYTISNQHNKYTHCKFMHKCKSILTKSSIHIHIRFQINEHTIYTLNTMKYKA